MASRAVARRDNVRSIGKRARRDFDEQQVELIARTVARDATAEELNQFLEIASYYNLNPFRGEIYFMKVPGKNGGAGRPSFIVGRDGFLRIAQENPHFEGLVGDVVRENDEFEAEWAWDDERGRPVLKRKHKYGKPSERGAVVGAWAQVFMEGQEPTYFFAPLAEYMPHEARAKVTPWANYESAMILKCAEVVALRKACSITGIYSEEEMDAARGAEAVAADPAYGSMPAPDSLAQDAALGEWLQQVFALANRVQEGVYRQAKIRAMLKNRSDAERRVIGLEVAQWVRENSKLEVPDPPAVGDAEGELIVDAEIVDDGDDGVVSGDAADDVEDAEVPSQEELDRLAAEQQDGIEFGGDGQGTL